MRAGRTVEVRTRKGRLVRETLGPRIEGAGGRRFAVHALARPVRHRMPESLGGGAGDGPRIVRREGREMVLGSERDLRFGEAVDAAGPGGRRRAVEVGLRVDRDDDGTVLHEIAEPLEDEGAPEPEASPSGGGDRARRAECRFAKAKGRWLVVGPARLLQEGKAALVERRSGVVETVAVGRFVERRPKGWAAHEFRRRLGETPERG